MEKIQIVDTNHSEKDRKPYNFPGLEVVDKNILSLMGEELNLPFWRNFDMERRQEIIDEGTDYDGDEWWTVSQGKFLDYNILNIMYYDPWNGKPARNMKAIAIFNMNSGRWTSKSPIKTELSKKLKKLISKMPKIIDSETYELEKK